MSTRLGLRVSVAALAVLTGIPYANAASPYEGRPIADIQFDPEKQPLETGQLKAMLPVQTGQPLRADDLRAAIQRLYATGEYSDISVDATDAANGVTLRFITKPAYFIGNVRVTGVPEPPNQGQLTVATKLQLGADFSEEQVKRAVDYLVDVMRRNGFYNATVVPQTSFEEGTQQVKIDFEIDAEKRAKYDGVIANGPMNRSIEKIIKSTHWLRPFGWFGWRQVTESRTESGIDNVRSWYPKHNYLAAKVALVRLHYHPSTNTVTPELAVDSGPKITVRVRGAKLSDGRLRNLLPIYEERAVDKDLLLEGTRDLAAYFQTRGYFDVRVNYHLALPPNGDELIDYDVDRGPHHKLVKLEIKGNHYFDDATLRERINVIPATLMRYRHGRYSRQYLERDLDAVRALYRSNGFRDVEVTSREIDDFAGQVGHIAIFIEVKEGPQWFVSKLEIEGISEADRQALRLILYSTEGQPYSDYYIASDRDAILDYYFNNGYPAAKFEFTAAPAAEPDRVNLKFVATPGERVYVRDVLINGLERTRSDLVRNRITLQPGDPISQNQINASQRRLYDLGIFARVNTALQDPDGDEPNKYVLYSLEEAGRYLTNVGFGAEIGRIGGGLSSLDSPAGVTGFSPRISLGVSRLNFLGLGHTVSLQTRVSTIEQRVLANYLAPQFEGNPNLNLQFSVLFERSHDVRTFSSLRKEGSVQLGEKFTRAFSVQYRYTFRKVNVLGTPLVTPELIPLLSQPVRVGFFSTTLIHDRRDDPLDAHHGVYTTVDLALAAGAFGSQTGFGRVIVQNSSYYQLTKSLVFARSTNFGIIQRYAGLPEIPLAERLFGGGSNSDRAFPDFQAGPRDLKTGFPIGGTAELFNSFELRFPLIGDNLGGALFNDLGNVYSSPSRISFRFRQNGLQDFDYGVQAFGFGIRYRTPIGPVRADFSLSPNSPRFFGFKGSINQLEFGGGEQVVQRINVFQFHFSLGQAF
ncbi:MAG TPA: POTRA domain-containing protein [Bryobacteraceae bacterium]|nr:POTRA domain-containing protein [Bryobacteraceae bacterium]